MNPTVKIIFGLLGGLAIFIYGMNIMSESLQKVAGDRMKKVLGLLTKNPFLGVLAGAVVTAVLQSSSATTVMTIGFVSAGLMTLPQAISIIMGANIGTTMTAQIIAFKISNYIYLFIFVGFVIWFACKSQRSKNIGLSILAFGLLFLGIETMGGVMKPLAKSAFFTNLIGKVSNIPVLGVLVGTMMTLVVQSSSATIAVLQNFASQPAADGVSSIIGLAGAIPILLGDNIGTTITALLASIGQSKDAKRAACAHCIFNITGTLLFIWFVKPYAALIQWLSPKGNEVDVISRQIANAHTGFNITMTAIWVFLIPVMVKIVMFIVPSKEDDYEPDTNEKGPKYLDKKLLGQPVPALQLTAKELSRCAQKLSLTLGELAESSPEKDKYKTPYFRIKGETDLIHELSGKINDYLASLFSNGVLTEEQAAKASEILYVLSDIDRLAVISGDVTENIYGRNEKGKHNKYSGEAIKDLQKALVIIQKMYDIAIQALLYGKLDKLDKLPEQKAEITKMVAKLRKNHTERISSGKCDVKLTVPYDSLLLSLDRMGNSVINLSDSISKREIFEDFLKVEGSLAASK